MKTVLIHRGACRLSIPAATRSRFWKLECKKDSRRTFLGTRRECIAYFHRLADGDRRPFNLRMTPNR